MGGQSNDYSFDHLPFGLLQFSARWVPEKFIVSIHFMIMTVAFYLVLKCCLQLYLKALE